MKNRQILSLLFFAGIVLFPSLLKAQYEDNPLRGKSWLSLAGGLNTADYISYQGMATWSHRGETMLTQIRLGYSQEFISSPKDSILERKNRILETGVMWGDAWAGRHWYVSGALGFGLNVRMYAAFADYGGIRYLTAVTIGVPAQVEAGFMASPRWGLGVSLVGNWNFRQPYGGALLTWHYRLK